MTLVCSFLSLFDTVPGSVERQDDSKEVNGCLQKNYDSGFVVFFLSVCVYFSFSIPNLQDGDQAPCVSLRGRSLLPHYHFDLEDSDYISGNRRTPEFSGPLDNNTRVIEFNPVIYSASSTR